jgi:ABC-type Fe3+-hydroxamate transport system substrate-binding protein
VTQLLADEKAAGVTDVSYYEDFSRRVSGIREELRAMVSHLLDEGKTLAGYGAAAKGTIMLNYAGIDHSALDFVADRNVHKQGRYMPGVHIPIVPPDRILQERPDYVLILPWNFKDEILEQQAAYRKAGGKFIVPIPSPEIV